ERYRALPHSAVYPSRAGEPPNRPPVLQVVPHHVAVVLDAVLAGVEEPNLVEFAVVPRCNLGALEHVEVREHVLMYITGQRAHVAVEHPEPGIAHPHHEVLRPSRRQGADQAAAGADLLYAVHKGRTYVVQGVDICFGPDKILPPVAHTAHDPARGLQW